MPWIWESISIGAYRNALELAQTDDIYCHYTIQWQIQELFYFSKREVLGVNFFFSKIVI